MATRPSFKRPGITATGRQWQMIEALRADGWGEGQWECCWRCPYKPQFPWVIHSHPIGVWDSRPDRMAAVV